MKKLLLVSLMVAVGFAESFPPIMPLPKSFTNGTATATISAKATLDVTGEKSDDLTAAYERFVANAFPHTGKTDGAIQKVSVNVAKNDVPLQLGADESYTMEIDATSVKISCPAIYGCYHGLESLSQMIMFDSDTTVYQINNVPWKIDDAPRFQHRGILVDSSRHFLPVKQVKIAIDAMRYSKLNVLHWHIVDSESWPIDIPSHPKLAAKGSYSMLERYTVDDIKDVVEYARQRGVRIMPEFDVPGHTAAMCQGEPDACPTPLCDNAIGYWALDFTKNYTYDLMKDVITDMASMFPETLMHLGGDEVNFDCWNARDYIKQWLKDHDMSMNDGYLYIASKAQDMAHAVKKDVVGWQELWGNFGTKLDKGTIIHQWLPNSVNLPKDVTSHGYRLIWSDSSVWYLDWEGTKWDAMYNAEPCKGLEDSECKLVLGGEGAMWGERIDTSDQMATIFPRMNAIAERLWSPRESAITNETKDRMAWFRCVMNHRGIAAAPLFNDGARQNPPHYGSCYEQ